MKTILASLLFSVVWIMSAAADEFEMAEIVNAPPLEVENGNALFPEGQPVSN